MAPRPSLTIVAAFAMAPLVGACGAAPLYPPETAAACRAGVGQACLDLGTTLRPEHPMKARAFLTAGCDAGEANACAVLGDMILRGEGAPPSRRHAITVLRGACQASPGSAACVALGDLEAGWIDQIGVGMGQTCVLTTGATLWCWGRNDRGQSGQRRPEVQVGHQRYGAEKAIERPRRVLLGGEDRPATALSVGESHACALDHRGEVWCWGNGERFGQLGLGAAYSAAPVQVVTEPEMIFGGAGYGWVGPPLTNARAVAAGACFSCALMEDGTVSCWGCSEGYWDDAAHVRTVTGVRDAQLLVAGAREACVLNGAGGVTCGLPDHPRVLEGVPPLVVGIAIGVAPLAVTADGGVWLWPSVGELPVRLDTPPAVEVLAWSDRACLRSAEGEVRCGYLRGDALEGLAPVGLGAVVDFDMARAGAGAHACGVAHDGRARCVGDNAWGQLGAGDREPHAGPVSVTLPRVP